MTAEPAANPDRSYVLTLVAPDAEAALRRVHPVLDESLCGAAVPLHAPGIRDEPTALDLPLDLPAGIEAEQYEATLRAEVDGLETDLLVQPAAGRRKRLLVADMESTLIREEMLDELADEIGERERISRITARAMNGELDFRDALRERVALLEGLPETLLDSMVERIHLDPGARFLVSTLASHGVATALVSGGFHRFADAVRDELQVETSQANRLEIIEGRLTGRVLEPILDRDAKVQALDRLCAEHEIERHEAVTVGDGANDLAMLRAAGLGVAYHGKPAVAAAARYRIDHGDLSTLLYYLGYRRETWRDRPEWPA